MSEFAVFLVTQSGLLEDGFEQAPREFLAVKWNDCEPSIAMDEFTVTAFAWEFLEACSTQFANDFLGPRRQRLPLLVRSHRRSVLLDAVLSRQAIQNVHGFRSWPARGSSNPSARFVPARGCAPKPIRAPLASSRARARTNRPATSRQIRLAHNRSRTWLRSGLERSKRCTFACVQYSPELFAGCEFRGPEVNR
jgi:hypothetical protein